MIIRIANVLMVLLGLAAAQAGTPAAPRNQTLPWWFSIPPWSWYQKPPIPKGPPGIKVYQLSDGFGPLFSTTPASANFSQFNQNQGVPFCVFERPPSGADSVQINLYSLPRPNGRFDMFLNNNPADISAPKLGATGALGYKWESTLGYMYKFDNSTLFLRPVYRFWDKVKLVHKYSSNPFEFGVLNQNNIASVNIVLEGLLGFTTTNC